MQPADYMPMLNATPVGDRWDMLAFAVFTVALFFAAAWVLRRYR
jgi:hypothetical protein